MLGVLEWVERRGTVVGLGLALLGIALGLGVYVAQEANVDVSSGVLWTLGGVSGVVALAGIALTVAGVVLPVSGEARLAFVEPQVESGITVQPGGLGASILRFGIVNQGADLHVRARLSLAKDGEPDWEAAAEWADRTTDVIKLAADGQPQWIDALVKIRSEDGVRIWSSRYSPSGRKHRNQFIAERQLTLRVDLTALAHSRPMSRW